MAYRHLPSPDFHRLDCQHYGLREDEHDDDSLISGSGFKHMKSGGRIIMIGSYVGERAMTPGLVAYSATKGAVMMFTQGLSREVGSRGITVNNV
jgi:short chain dehydrogenase